MTFDFEKHSGWLTEKEAKQEDCPHFTFIVNELDVISEKQTPIYVPIKCKASACRMAWRWRDVHAADK